MSYFHDSAKWALTLLGPERVQRGMSAFDDLPNNRYTWDGCFLTHALRERDGVTLPETLRHALFGLDLPGIDIRASRLLTPQGMTAIVALFDNRPEELKALCEEYLEQNRVTSVEA